MTCDAYGFQSQGKPQRVHAWSWASWRHVTHFLPWLLLQMLVLVLSPITQSSPHCTQGVYGRGGARLTYLIWTLMKTKPHWHVTRKPSVGSASQTASFKLFLSWNKEATPSKSGLGVLVTDLRALHFGRFLFVALPGLCFHCPHSALAASHSAGR